MERHDPKTLKRARGIARLLGALLGLLGGVFYALYLIPNSSGVLDRNYGVAIATLSISALLGLVLGFVAGPSVSVDPFLWLQRTLDEAEGVELVGGAIGLVIALVASALLTVPLIRLPDGVGFLVSAAITIVLVYMGVTTGVKRRGDIASFANRLTAGRGGASSHTAVDDRPDSPTGSPSVLDTSVLIDGRVLDVARAGFLPPCLLIPAFVLEELQRVADAGDPLRRAKGRRGLACVEGLQALTDPKCEIVDLDFPGVPEVDSRLIRLARARNASIMTTDYMLNRLAHIEGLRVLNLNDLALALKPIVSAGETMEVTIVKEGKEIHQGVGYLDDGTMIVVENGRDHIDETVTATVTSVIQTPAGRMIFALVPPPAKDAAAASERRSRSGRSGVPRPKVVGP